MPSLDRRTLVTGALAAAAVPRIADAAVTGVPPSGRLKFNILRNGKPFGTYQVVFLADGASLTATTDVTMSMKIAALTVFDYKHHCEEIWRGGRIEELRSRTVRDGKPETVSAVRQSVGISCTTPKGKVMVPSTASPLTHWNQSILGGLLFNPQTGFTLNVTGQKVGRDSVTLANGGRLLCDHWQLRGESQIDNWYDDAGVWAGLRGVLPDKSIMEYRRV